ncbi:hypothetical protein GUJ93_ZPchr0010g9853 [Zizania palustris]|uniref:Uncharacterized protein n=1 Tax=Zizania palustris TaxID=103762 RepID=A0A8J6BGZ8_ZIZPA|nr:hypothetical protein GUJ93_ZPchr0010g9853 [Zizania palustris]
MAACMAPRPNRSSLVSQPPRRARASCAAVDSFLPAVPATAMNARLHVRTRRDGEDDEKEKKQSFAYDLADSGYRVAVVLCLNFQPPNPSHRARVPDVFGSPPLSVSPQTLNPSSSAPASAACAAAPLRWMGWPLAS